MATGPKGNEALDVEAVPSETISKTVGETVAEDVTKDDEKGKNVDVEAGSVIEAPKGYYSKLSVWLMVLFSGLAIGSDG
jgi:hypothetical protein